MAKAVKIFCALGASSSILEKAIADAAAEQGLDITVKAYTVNSFEAEAGSSDVILLSPQTRYKAISAKRDYPNVPIETIDMRDYASHNGPKIIDQIKKYL